MAGLALFRRRLIDAVDQGARAFWLSMFLGLTSVGLLDQSFNNEIVAFSYLILSVFVILAEPKAAPVRPSGPAERSRPWLGAGPSRSTAQLG